MSVNNFFPDHYPWQRVMANASLEIEELAVTENGTYAEDGKAYSPVVVNVPSDFSTATVTVVNSDDTYTYNVFLPDAYEIEEDGETYSGIEIHGEVEPGDTYIMNVPLYGTDGTSGFVAYWAQDVYQLTPATISVSGDITAQDHLVSVTGNGTITITGMVD